MLPCICDKNPGKAAQKQTAALPLPGSQTQRFVWLTDSPPLCEETRAAVSGAQRYRGDISAGASCLLRRMQRASGIPQVALLRMDASDDRIPLIGVGGILQVLAWKFFKLHAHGHGGIGTRVLRWWHGALDGVGVFPGREGAQP